MEIIQNADDNQYDESVTPTLAISVRPEFVKVECNETGFTRENIQAICRTGQSSKPPGQGYTGEKGIGFKSVFKIAKQAHIRSPPYFFLFDQDRDLGMITPQWDERFFKDHQQDFQTTIVLDNPVGALTDFSAALKDDIDSIHPVIILFLRRIDRLHITRLKAGNSRNDRPVSKRFRRHAQSPPMQNITSLEDEDSGSRESFYKLRYSAAFEGIEERRPGISETEIVLAFPVQQEKDAWVPKPTQLPTFAYLPLGNFGFNVRCVAQCRQTSADFKGSSLYRQTSSPRQIVNQ
jgi:hypothetical protein